MKFTRLQIVNMVLGAASLAIGWFQNIIDGKLTEDYVKEEVNRILEEKNEC